MNSEDSGDRRSSPEVAQSRLAGPTMTEVATAAGVSQTTVSLVLNDALGARLSPQTRQRVLDAAKDLGYRLVKRGTPRALATDMIGLIVDELSTDPWCAIALDGARDKAWEHGLTISIAVTRGDQEMEQAVQAQMASQPLVGLIYGTIQTRPIKPTPALYQIPTILMNCFTTDWSLPSIVPGEILGGQTATNRLINAGHRRIGMIEGEVWMDASRARLKGYRQALANADILFDAELVRPGNWEPSAGYSQTLQLMALKNPPTAIFCSNDLMAMGCYEALKELEMRIPEDVAVVGYDDREIARFARPPLTTILLPHFEMGKRAAEFIINNLASRKGRQPQIKVECPLVERSSVGPLTIN